MSRRGHVIRRTYSLGIARTRRVGRPHRQRPFQSPSEAARLPPSRSCGDECRLFPWSASACGPCVLAAEHLTMRRIQDRQLARVDELNGILESESGNDEPSRP